MTLTHTFFLAAMAAGVLMIATPAPVDAGSRHYGGSFYSNNYGYSGRNYRRGRSYRNRRYRSSRRYSPRRYSSRSYRYSRPYYRSSFSGFGYGGGAYCY